MPAVSRVHKKAVPEGGWWTKNDSVCYIEECLLASPYITAVTGMTVAAVGDRLAVAFAIQTVYGEIKMEVETDVG